MVRIKSGWPLNRYSILFSFLALYLLTFLVLPVGSMVLQGLTNAEGQWVGDHLRLLLANPVYLESLGNSLGIAAGAAVVAALGALPIAMALWRHHVRPSVFVELCGLLPLFVPPFVLALSLQSLLGRGGALGLWFQSYGDLDPANAGLLSVMLIEAIHYFPLVLMTLVLTTSAYSQQAKEATNLGCGWLRLMARVFLPLGMPGLAFGMSITFLKTLDDLATPLSLGVTNLLAPQAFLRVSAYGSQDPLSSLIAMLMIVISGLTWLASVRLVRRHVTFRSEAFANASTPPSRQQMAIGIAFLGSILAFYAILYAGVAISSIARVWSYTLLPESFVFSHYLAAINDERASFINTLAYCGFAAVLDVLIGLLMAYAINCASPFWKKWLSWGAAGLLSVPGVALAIAYLQFFRSFELPLINQAIDASWFMLPMAFSVRGLPFAIRACSIALHAVPANCVEAANISGRSFFTVATKIILPMMTFGLFVAFLLCFGLAAADLSPAMLLAPSETNAPVSYTIYLNMQSTTGRGAGSALAILSIALLTLSLATLLALIRQNWKTVSSFRKFVFTAS